MAVVAGGISSAIVSAAATVSWTHTPGATDTLVIASISLDFGGSGFSATYDGVAMTLIDGSGSAPAALMWYREIAEGGGAKTVAISWTTARSGYAGAASYNGRRTVAAGGLGTAVTTTGSSAAPAVTVVGEVNGRVHGCAAQAGIFDSDAGMTRIYLTYAAGAAHDDGAVSAVMTWGTDTSTGWRTVGIAINPISVGDRIIWYMSTAGWGDKLRDIFAPKNGILQPRELGLVTI